MEFDTEGRLSRKVLFSLCLMALAQGAIHAALPPGVPARAILRVRSGSDLLDELAAFRPDARLYIRAVRILGESVLSTSPGGVFSGLVRPGGEDPRSLEDAPMPGRGSRYDIVLFADAFEEARTSSWLRMILDHEYFHARHLAGEGPAPLVDFGAPNANQAWYEATAWAFVVAGMRAGDYGDFSESESREARASYRRHAEGIRAFILERQPTAWTHYSRFMPSMDEGAGARPKRAEVR